MTDQKIAVVTGGTTGIGKATTIVLQERGFKVIPLFYAEGSTDRFCCDVRDEAQVKAVFASILKEWKKIDVLVNCAAILSNTDTLKIPTSEWDNIFRTNVVGTYLACQQVIPGMKERKYGKIVNISSIAGRTFSKTASLTYSASKHAVIGMTKKLGDEFGPFGLNINCVCPSHTRTEVIAQYPDEVIQKVANNVPLKRLAEPSEMAKVIAFLASDDASYMTGAIVDVNGGQL